MTPADPSAGAPTARARIVVDDLTGPAVAAFLEEHVAEMRAVTPPESKHALDLAGLRRPEVTFWTAIDGTPGDGTPGDGTPGDTVLVGTAALLRLGEGHGEVKSMRVAPAYRGRGVAALLLGHVEAAARAEGLTRLSLETGSFAFFDPARRLYLRHGFTPCGPFGGYAEDPNAAFLTKVLA